MELISREELLHDLIDYFGSYGYARVDTRIFGDVINTVKKQREVVSLRGNYGFRAILAPCPKCGSFNVGVYADKIEEDEGILPHYRGHFKCLDCQEHYHVRGMDMPSIFIEWNRFYERVKKGEEAI